VERFWPAPVAGLLALVLIVGWGIVHNTSIVRQLVTIAVGLIVGIVVFGAVFLIVLGNNLGP
jgi:hypothetical protein